MFSFICTHTLIWRGEGKQIHVDRKQPLCHIFKKNTVYPAVSPVCGQTWNLETEAAEVVYEVEQRRREGQVKGLSLYDYKV